MYNLKLSDAEVSTIYSALITAKNNYQQNPLLFEDEIKETTAVLEKMCYIVQTTVDERIAAHKTKLVLQGKTEIPNYETCSMYGECVHWQSDIEHREGYCMLGCMTTEDPDGLRCPVYDWVESNRKPIPFEDYYKED